jgi:hypothetical protein
MGSFRGRVLQPVRVSLGFHEPVSPSQVSLNKTSLNWWELQIGEVIDTVDFLAFIFRSALLGWLRRDDAGEMRSELAILVPILIKGIICFSKSRFTATSPNLNSYEGQAVHSRIDIGNYILDIRSVVCRDKAFLQKAFQHGKEPSDEINVIRSVLESPIQRSLRLSGGPNAVSPEPQISKSGLDMDLVFTLQLLDALLELLEA